MSPLRRRTGWTIIGLSLALLEALNDIGASEYLGVQTLTLSIFTTWINRGSLPGAAQIACVMLVIVIALMALERLAQWREKAEAETGDLSGRTPARLIAAQAILQRGRKAG